MKNSKPIKMKKTTYPLHKPQSVQEGLALIVTIVVLLGLTVLALATTNSNLSQSIMVRNNQFRLEEFNTSYAEIEGQVDAINVIPLSQGVPDYVISLIDNIVPRVSSASTDPTTAIDITSPTETNYMDRLVEQVYDGQCFVFGEETGVGNDKIRCDQIRIESQSRLDGRNVGGSDQRQVYRYKTLAL